MLPKRVLCKQLLYSRYFRTIQDVQNDYELQNWIKEIAVEGFTYAEGMKSTCPKEFVTKSELVNGNRMLNLSDFYSRGLVSAIVRYHGDFQRERISRCGSFSAV